MKGYIRIVDAGFNELHGRGPTLATLKNPIISTVDGISGLFSSIPRPVIKDNLLKLSFNQMQFYPFDIF